MGQHDSRAEPDCLGCFSRQELPLPRKGLLLKARRAPGGRSPTSRESHAPDRVGIFSFDWESL
jgi:hypothetical protein